MNISHEIPMTVAYVCARQADGKLAPRGTAFFIGHHFIGSPTKVCVYVVTAKHVIDGIIGKLGCETVHLSFNGQNGKQIEQIPYEDWHFHPDIASEFIDVAIARIDSRLFMTPPRAYGVEHLRVRYWMTSSVFSAFSGPRKELFPGSEIGITGLFSYRPGSAANIPIVRCGTIAAMPTEPVGTRLGLMSAFLVELRSIGGLSGSPVFTTLNGNVGVIGMIHGHFDKPAASSDMSIELDTASASESINAGIGIVIPSEKIRETLKNLIEQDMPLAG